MSEKMFLDDQRVFLFGVGGLVMGRLIAVVDEAEVRLFSPSHQRRSLVERAAGLLGGDVRMEGHYAKNKIRPFYDLFEDRSTAGRFFCGPTFEESVRPFQHGDTRGCLYFFLGTNGIVPKDCKMTAA